ncbi:MAG TPA: signal peptidase I [Longimicrobium sp.]
MATAAVIILRTFVVQVYGVTTPSMAGTLRPGDYVMTSNAVFGPRVPLVHRRLPAFRGPRHGEVVVFDEGRPGAGPAVIKRIIGVPGDTLQMIDRTMLRNGRLLRERYLAAPSTADERLELDGPLGVRWHLEALPAGASPAVYEPSRDTWGPLVVPAGHYFVMGDNRDWSVDSRVAGFIARSRIRGKVLAIYYSADPASTRPFPRAVTALRPRRIGRVR